MPHSHPGKYPRLPIRGALERYCSSKLHMRPALRCTRRRGGGQGGHQSPREIWTSGRSNARACSVRGFLSAYCSIICVLKLDSDGKAGGSHPSLGSHPGPVVFVASETRRDDDGLRLL